MSELRLNAVSNEWVIIAPERARRPRDFATAAIPRPPLPEHRADCPFCPGNEHLSAETFRHGGAERWQVRVVRNKFPALAPEGNPQRTQDGVFRAITGIGIHEVIIEHPRHDAQLARLTDDEVAAVLAVCRDRYRTASADPRIAAVVIFKNHGPRAGTSLEHAHLQLIGTPVVPPQVRVRHERALRFYDEFGECLYCRMLAQELAARQRLVVATDYFVTFIPYAALSPFHTWIFPRRHCSSFAELADAELRDLAANLRQYLGKLDRGLHNPDFNLSIRSFPAAGQADPALHWYVSVVPRVSQTAGFELGSGMFVNGTLPEESARFLRETD